MASKSDSEESKNTVETIDNNSTSDDGSDENENVETKVSEASPTGKVRQMANEWFEALDNVLEEIESTEREESNEMEVDESPRSGKFVQ